MLYGTLYDNKPSQYIQYDDYTHTLHTFCAYFFGGQPCLGHSFAYVAHFISVVEPEPEPEP